MAEKHVLLKIKRQSSPGQPARWEEFSLRWRPSMNIIICLRDIAENPVTLDGTYSLGEGPRVAPEIQEKGYPLSRCMTCGLCLEVCPQVNAGNNFVGAAIISQVRLFNMHPTGAMHAKERIQALLGEGGIEECANAQNCVQACPKAIPLTESIAEVNRAAWKQSLLGWLLG